MSSHRPSQPRVLVSYCPFQPSVGTSLVSPFDRYGTCDDSHGHIIRDGSNSFSTLFEHEMLAAVRRSIEQRALGRPNGHATHLVLSTFRLYPSATLLYFNNVPAWSSRLRPLFDYLSLCWSKVPILLHLGGNDIFAPEPPSQQEILLDMLRPQNVGIDSRHIPSSERTFASLNRGFWYMYPVLRDFIWSHKISGVLLDIQEYDTDAKVLGTLLAQLKIDFGNKFIVSFVLDREDLQCCSPGNRRCPGIYIPADSAQTGHASNEQRAEDQSHAEEPNQRRSDLCVREVERQISGVNGSPKVDFYVVRFAGRISLRQLRLNLKNYGDVCAAVQDWCPPKKIVAGLAHMHAEDAAAAGGMKEEVALLAQWYRIEFGGIAGGIDAGMVQGNSEEAARLVETMLWADEMHSAIKRALEERHDARE